MQATYDISPPGPPKSLNTQAIPPDNSNPFMIQATYDISQLEAQAGGVSLLAAPPPSSGRKLQEAALGPSLGPLPPTLGDCSDYYFNKKKVNLIYLNYLIFISYGWVTSKPWLRIDFYDLF